MLERLRRNSFKTKILIFRSKEILCFKQLIRAANTLSIILSLRKNRSHHHNNTKIFGIKLKHLFIQRRKTFTGNITNISVRISVTSIIRVSCGHNITDIQRSRNRAKENGAMVFNITLNTIMGTHVILNTITSTKSRFTPNLNGF